MRTRARISVYVGSALVVIVLVALAVPATIGLFATATAAGTNLARALEAPVPIVAPVDRGGDSLDRPASKITCERYTDHGVHEYARGEVVETSSAGRVLTYRVAAGDTLIGMMERFCAPSSAHIFYANDMQLRPNPVPYPGEVIRIRGY